MIATENNTSLLNRVVTLFPSNRHNHYRLRSTHSTHYVQLALNVRRQLCYVSCKTSPSPYSWNPALQSLASYSWFALFRFLVLILGQAPPSQHCLVPSSFRAPTLSKIGCRVSQTTLSRQRQRRSLHRVFVMSLPMSQNFSQSLQAGRHLKNCSNTGSKAVIADRFKTQFIAIASLLCG